MKNFKSQILLEKNIHIYLRNIYMRKCFKEVSEKETRKRNNDK